MAPPNPALSLDTTKILQVLKDGGYFLPSPTSNDVPVCDRDDHYLGTVPYSTFLAVIKLITPEDRMGKIFRFFLLLLGLF